MEDQEQQESNSNNVSNDDDDNKATVQNSVAVSNIASDAFNKQAVIKIEATDTYTTTHDTEAANESSNAYNGNVVEIKNSNAFNRNFIKIEESNINNCNLLKSEEPDSYTTDTMDPTPQTEDIKPMVLYKCQLCDSTCNSLESVVVHGKSLKCSSLHKLSKKEKPLFKCELCQCKYKTLNLLTIHLKRHIARKYRCTHCPKTYVSQMELEYHQRCHRDERPHQCDLCPNSFRYVHHLKRHKDIIHYGKRHTCPESNCNRQFTTLDQLKIHKWSHYGIVPYKCSYCERLFKKRFL